MLGRHEGGRKTKVSAKKKKKKDKNINLNTFQARGLIYDASGV